jgi:hypothetical protein
MGKCVISACSPDSSRVSAAINASGWVVGVSGTAGGTLGFVHDGSAMYKLSSLFEQECSDWGVTDAKDINDAGQIVAHAQNDPLPSPFYC